MQCKNRYAILNTEVMKMEGNIMLCIWLGLTILFVIGEALTAQLTTIWFAAGSLAAMLLEVFGVKNITAQITAFILVSVISLIATRPFVKKVINKKTQPTNADRNIGATGIVTEEICNLHATGAVSLKGIIWTARSADDSVISAGSSVKVLRIDGVKLIVEKI